MFVKKKQVTSSSLPAFLLKTFIIQFPTSFAHSISSGREALVDSLF